MRAHVLKQDNVWVDGRGQAFRLDEMDARYRANLIPFLRRNAKVLKRCAEFDLATVIDEPAEDWLERTPLMRKLVELEAGRPFDDRRDMHEQNVAYEKATGYQKVVLR